MRFRKRSIKQGRRKLLVEMATGTGKTRTAAAFIKRLFEANLVTRVPFLVDHTTLAKQTEDAFAEYLPELPAYRLKPNRPFDDAKRITIWQRRNSGNGKYSSTQFKDIYCQAEQAKLGAHVPADIREHFATALNLVAYSWFYYPFATQAEFAAYTTVEKALKLRFAYPWTWVDKENSGRAFLCTFLWRSLLLLRFKPFIGSRQTPR